MMMMMDEIDNGPALVPPSVHSFMKVTISLSWERLSASSYCLWGAVCVCP